MKPIDPIALEGRGVSLEPLGHHHADGLCAAVRDGALWELWFTRVPGPDDVAAYIAKALDGMREGHILPWVVRESGSGTILGSTRYHDIARDVDRVEIGYTWYARSKQGTTVNPACKLLLMQHAFESLECKVVALRTDPFNFRSQRAIERLGAKKDGVIRRHQLRRDGSVADTVMYSVLLQEWPEVKRNLLYRLAKRVPQPPPPHPVPPP
jgi:RimJ/RimL family protein N-acetyltransferase